jgi:hypothetical protein
MSHADQLIELLKEWRVSRTNMYEEWHNDMIWELVDQIPDGRSVLEDEFKKLPKGELQKLHLAMLLLERYPCMAAYVYLTENAGFTAETLGSSLYQGAAELRKQGKIK